MTSGASVLMVCTAFGTGADSRYLTNELAEAMVAQGARVMVVAIRWSAAEPLPDRLVHQGEGLDVLFVSPHRLGRGSGVVQALYKWGLSSFFLRRRVAEAFGARPVDLIVAFSPLVTATFILRWAFRRYRCRGFAYLADFFPFHQHALGSLPGGPLLAIGRWAENGLLRLFSAIGCMSPAGATYLRRHYRLEERQQVAVVPLWGDVEPLADIDRAAVRASHGITSDRRVVLFGGQITEGRGVEDMLAVAGLAAERHPDLLFLFAGSGRLRALVAERADMPGSNIVLLDPLPRPDYLRLAQACDVGIVSTVAGTGVPTFPSKTIDYLRARLPVAASVETSTDYADFVETNGIGLAVAAGDPDRFLSIIAAIAYDEPRAAAMRGQAAAVLSANFDVRETARRVLAMTG
jgi:glycosyltransferase involved in cell wall biosynthesis